MTAQELAQFQLLCKQGQIPVYQTLVRQYGSNRNTIPELAELNNQRLNPQILLGDKDKVAYNPNTRQCIYPFKPYYQKPGTREYVYPPIFFRSLSPEDVKRMLI